MSWEALAWAKQTTGLGTSKKFLLVLLAEKADGFRCWPSVGTLAREMECSPRTVQRLLSELLDAGVIEREARYRPNGSRTTDLILLVRGGDNLSPQSDQAEPAEVDLGPERHPPHDTQTVTPPMTARVSPPEHHKNPKENLPTPSGRSEVAWTDTDGAMFLLQAEPVEITAQVVVAAWVDAIRENGVEPSKAQIGRVARTAKELLAKNNGDLVLEAARHAGEHGHAAIDSSMTFAAGKPLKPKLRSHGPSVKIDQSTGRQVEMQ